MEDSLRIRSSLLMPAALIGGLSLQAATPSKCVPAQNAVCSNSQGGSYKEVVFTGGTVVADHTAFEKIPGAPCEPIAIGVSAAAACRLIGNTGGSTNHGAGSICDIYSSAFDPILCNDIFALDETAAW